jgi:hypothetical protein
MTGLAMLLTHVLIVLAAPLASLAAAASPGASALPEGAAANFLPAAPERAWQTIVLHHSATTGGSVESIDAAHRRRRDSAGNPWLGIGYHFVVGNGHSMPDGEVQSTFRWKRQLAGAHAGHRDQNEHGIGICLIGDFEAAPPTEKQLAALEALLKLLADRYAITRTHVLRHQDVHATLCPGRLFPWNKVLAELPSGDGS